MTIADIQKAYRQQSKTVHPDKDTTPGAAERFHLLEAVKDHLLTRWMNTSWRVPFLNLHLKNTSTQGESHLQDLANEAAAVDDSMPDENIVSTGVFMAQQALRQALQSRARANTITTSAEHRLVSCDSALALKGLGCRPQELAKVPRGNPVLKSQVIKSAQDKLIASRTNRRADRLHAQRQKLLAQCAEQNKQYIGRTTWRISRLAREWARAAHNRVKIETIRSRRAIAPAPSQVRQQRPDERVADDRAWQQYRRSGHEENMKVKKALEHEFVTKPERFKRVEKQTKKETTTT